MYCFGNLRPLVFWGILFGVRICLARHLMNKYSTALNIGYGPGGPYWGQQFQTMVACHLLEPLISTDTTQLIHANVLLHQGFDMTAKFWRPTSKFSVFSCMSFVLCSMFCLLSTLHRKIHVDPFFCCWCICATVCTILLRVSRRQSAWWRPPRDSCTVNSNSTNAAVATITMFFIIIVVVVASLFWAFWVISVSCLGMIWIISPFLFFSFFCMSLRTSNLCFRLFEEVDVRIIAEPWSHLLCRFNPSLRVAALKLHQEIL